MNELLKEDVLKLSKSLKDLLLLLISVACIFLYSQINLYFNNFKIPLLIGGIIIIVLAILYKYENKYKGICYKNETTWMTIGFYIMSIANVGVCLINLSFRFILFCSSDWDASGSDGFDEDM